MKWGEKMNEVWVENKGAQKMRFCTDQRQQQYRLCIGSLEGILKSRAYRMCYVLLLWLCLLYHHLYGPGKGAEGWRSLLDVVEEHLQ